MSPHFERHPHDYPWRRRFPDAEVVPQGEGGAIYSAVGEGAWWLISDEGTMADLVEEDLGALITLQRFDDRHCWHQAVLERRHVRFRQALERRLEETVPAIAAFTQQRAAELGLTRINERDHLQPWSEEVLQRGLARPESALSLLTAYRPAYPVHWPRLGGVDIALSKPDVKPVVIELKCGAGADALGPCVWDVCKVAQHLRMGDASAGYLLAATTAANWQKPVRGAEFGGPGSWTVRSLREAYADWWLQWQRRNDPPPRQLTERGETALIARAPFTVGGHPWELRLSRVTVHPAGWFDWEPLTV